MTRIDPDRGAESQRLVRRLNGRLVDAVRGRLGDSEEIPFLCECADVDCKARVSATLAEYEGVRARPDRFLLVPGHATLDTEAIVEENRRFQVAERRR